MWIKLFNDGGPKVSYCGIYSNGEAFLCPCAQAVISLNLMSVKNDQLSACVVCPFLCQAFVSRTLFPAASKIHVFGKYNLNKNGIRLAQKISLLNYLYISLNLFTCFTLLVYGQLLHVNFISERRGEIFRRFRLRRINRP